MRVLDWRTLERPKQAAEHHWRYGLLVEDIEVDGFHCESYGMVVTDEATGEEERVRHVTVNAGEAIELLGALVRNAVTPITWMEVVEDWLARGPAKRAPPGSRPAAPIFARPLSPTRPDRI